MPRYDKTGPMGMGPKTGRGMGYCPTVKKKKGDVEIIETDVYVVKEESIPERIIRKIL